MDWRKAIKHLNWRLASGGRSPDRIGGTVWIDRGQIAGHNNTKLHPDSTSRFILDGDWDIEFTRSLQEYLEKDYRVRTVYELFVEKRHFTDTTEYRRMYSEIEANGKTRNHYRTKEELAAYFQKMNTVFANIQEHGLLAQEQLGKKAWKGIGCAVDRKGRILKSNNGHHRFAMACVLGIKRIPVAIRHVHHDWANPVFRASRRLSLYKTIFAELQRTTSSRSRVFSLAPFYHLIDDCFLFLRYII